MTIIQTIRCCIADQLAYWALCIYPRKTKAYNSYLLAYRQYLKKVIEEYELTSPRE